MAHDRGMELIADVFRMNRFKDDAPSLPAPSLQFITCGVHDARLDSYKNEHLRAGLDAFLGQFVKGKPALHADAHGSARRGGRAERQDRPLPRLALRILYPLLYAAVQNICSEFHFHR